MEAILPPMPLSIWAVILRFLCAMAVGTVIGIEREYSGRPAGMRTHILVALGAINDQSAAQGANICGMQTQRTGDGYRILFRADISGFHYRKRRRNFLNGIAAHPAVTSIHVYHKEDIPIA